MYDIYGEYRAPPDESLTAMFRHHDFYSRLREFRLDGEIDVLSYIFPNGTPRPFRLVSLSVERCATILLMRGITGVLTRRSHDPPIPAGLVEASFGSLKRLCISACTIDFDQAPIARQLTHLSLTNFNLPHLRVSMKKLLFLLQANPDLEELLFDHGGCELEFDDDEDLPFVSFARLRKLCVMLRSQDTPPFFRHLRVASGVEEIEVRVDASGSRREMPEIIPSWLNDVVSPRSVQSIEARPVSQMFRPGMKYIWESDRIQHPSLPHHSLVKLQLHPSRLSSFLTLEILRNVTRLELLHDDLSASRCLGIFEMASTLQELVTWAGRECNSVRALLPTSQGSREDVGSISYVPLPKLSYLRVIEADLKVIQDDDEPSNEVAILNLVRQRKILGLGLHRLELVCCEGVSPGWVDKLRSFVLEVSWDGVGEASLDDSDEDYSLSELSDSGSDDSSWETYDSGSDDPGLELYVSDEEDTATSESSDWIPGAFLGGAAR